MIFIGLYIVLLSESFADEWNTGSGGKPSRHSLSNEYGPEAATLLWQNGINAVIAQQAVIDGSIVAMSRIFNLNNVLYGTAIVAQDLFTGDTLWTTQLPVDFPSTDWRSRVSAFRDGVIYATRSGNTNYSYMYALDATNGSVIWQSEELVNESSTESASFAGNGDLIVGNFESIIRINGADGSTVWQTNRSCPTSNGQEVAVYFNRGYYWEASPGGPKVSVIDLTSGNYLYSSEGLTPGFIQQLGLFIGPDGIIYAPRTMNNAATDFLFALKDNGMALEELWNVPLGYVPFATFGVGPDGSVYSYSTSGEVIRIDSETGTVLDNSSVILTGASSSPRMAIDANGYVFVTNGEFPTGAVYSFNPDLSIRWSENITNVNVGGPAIGSNGTLVVCGIGTNVRAYQGSYSVVADFTASAVEICQEEYIQFFDASNGNIFEWEWLFEGGIPEISTDSNPIVSYPDYGNFDVTLIVSDGTLSDTLFQNDFVTVHPMPEVLFDELPEFCVTDPPYELTEGEPEGGDYSGPGVLYGTFNPAIAGIGTHTLYYTYYDEYGCGDTAMQQAIVSTCTGISQKQNNIPCLIYPIPADDHCHIEFQSKGAQKARLDVLDNFGKLLITQNIRSAQNGHYKSLLSLISLRPGLYFVRITIDNQTVIIGKIVKK
jgi:outer membrane protein assembly factor BamB